MSYARFSNESDVYIYMEDDANWMCHIKGGFAVDFSYLGDLLDYLKKLVDQNFKVPQEAFNRIEYELKTGVGLLSNQPLNTYNPERNKC